MIGTITRIRFLEVTALRAEFLLWLMTLTMPLIMLVFWRAVARDGPFGGYDATGLTGYFIAVLAVALLTDCNAVWNINEEIRTGELSYWLIKPVHPLVGYVTMTLAELPMRLAIAVPVLGVALALTGGGVALPARIALGAVAILGGLAINQAIQILVGSLGFWITKSIMVHRLVVTISSVLSGYMFPLTFLPEGVREAALWLPFRFIISLPVEIVTGRHPPAAAALLLLAQFGVCVAVNAVALAVWRRGVRRYEAYG